MANGNFSRNERFGAGREKYESSYGRDRGDSRRPRGDFPDWDRYGSYRDVGRERYTAGSRDEWQTDDLGYGEFGYNDAETRRPFAPDYDDRRHARQRGDDRYYGPKRDFMDRASDEVASWFGDEDAERRREMDQHRGKGPKGYIRTDERILDDVNDRLADDAMLDASDIEVSVTSGDVTLNGFVKNRGDKRRAEDIADLVSGVKNVQNNLRIKPTETLVNVAS